MTRGNVKLTENKELFRVLHYFKSKNHTISSTFEQHLFKQNKIEYAHK